MPELSVQNLQKKFGNKVRALDDVSLDVEAGSWRKANIDEVVDS